RINGGIHMGSNTASTDMNTGVNTGVNTSANTSNTASTNPANTSNNAPNSKANMASTSTSSSSDARVACDPDDKNCSARNKSGEGKKLGLYKHEDKNKDENRRVSSNNNSTNS